jgi:hypothetical protein
MEVHWEFFAHLHHPRTGQLNCTHVPFLLRLVIASQLGIPHHQVPAADLTWCFATISERIEVERRKKALQVLPPQRDCERLGPDLNVLNELTAKITATAQQTPLLELARAVHGSSKQKSRGDICSDIGCSSDINARRTKEPGGAATQRRSTCLEPRKALARRSCWE